MHTKVLLFVTIVAAIALCHAAPADHHNDRSRDYIDSAGRYMHYVQPYRHVHDNRELGKYVHIPNPYDGGYGPYAGSNIPYVHDARPYEHVSNADFKVPALRLEYGFPEYEAQIAPHTEKYDNSEETEYPTTTKKPTTTTKRTTTTTTTTTTTPRNILFNYDDEGGHRILHQQEKRKHDKYDHNYLTENGIYGEEQAKLHHAGGTHATGYYEYTGDDGQLYRVNYKSNHEGFMPEGDHIPTPPPIPEAIARALKYVDEKRKANGENPIFDHRGFRIDNMPKEMWDEIRKAQREIASQEEEQLQKDMPWNDDAVETTTMLY